MAAAGSGSGVRKVQFLLLLDFILESFGGNEFELWKAGGSKPGRAGPGRAVVKVGAGDDGAEYGANVNRGQTGPKCTAGAGEIFALNTDSCPATIGGGATGAADLAARLVALSARYLSSMDSEQGLGLGV